MTQVKETEIYKDSQGEHIVSKGKVKFVTLDIFPEIGMLGSNKTHPLFLWTQDHKNSIKNLVEYQSTKLIQPIIISLFDNELSNMQVGDFVYHDKMGIGKITQTDVSFQMGHKVSFYNENICCKTLNKILAMPENFSPKHLQAIIDVKIKDGDEVYVEVDPNRNLYINSSNYRAYNYITMFPCKKEKIYTSEDIKDIAYKAYKLGSSDMFSRNYRGFEEWFNDQIKK